jgi:hypothetical protein
MALKPLDPSPTVSLGSGWELVASEAGRSNRGIQATVTLFNGTAQACQTLALGDPAAQQALTTAFAAIVCITGGEMTKALMQLTVAVEGVLRQMAADPQVEDHPSQATVLAALAMGAGAELFHAPEGDAYATIAVDGHQETWPLKVRGFRRWLARLYYEEEGKAPGSQAIQDALGVLEGKAVFDGDEYPVYTRLAEHNGALYLDLADERWQAVEITASGWQVVETPPVKFRRTKGMLPLPEPVPGGNLAALRPFVNVASEEDWRLLVSWLIAALRPIGPYPVLIIYGEQGSAKSSLVRILRALVDPNTAALRTTPREERDLVIAATNGWLIALDNLSHLPDWLSDALCRLATGSGFATRELYTDAEEAIFAAQRPIVVNGIEEVATRGDLLDRALILYLPTIPEAKRQDEKAFRQAFEQARPTILGALLDTVSATLRTLPTVQLAHKPRMADFAVWACAAAEACGWTAKDFLDAYQGVREVAYELTLEASPVAPFIRQFITSRGQWTGMATELLAELEVLAAGGPTPQGTMQVRSDVTQQKGWPKNGRALSNVLRRLAPTLRAVGVGVILDGRTGKAGSRMIQLHTLTVGSPPGQAAGTCRARAGERDPLTCKRLGRIERQFCVSCVSCVSQPTQVSPYQALGADAQADASRSRLTQSSTG